MLESVGGVDPAANSADAEEAFQAACKKVFEPQEAAAKSQ